MRAGQTRAKEINLAKQKTSSRGSMQIISELKENLGEEWIPQVYQNKVRVLRTRAHSLTVQQKENKTEILHTLLGVELKIGRQRISCPDLATARFLQVFARIGVSAVAIPYDITKISVLADELESAWQRLWLIVQNNENHSPNKKRSLRSSVVKELRKEIEEIGAGVSVPEFNQNTKQQRF
jgi:hypothetical protein